MPAVKGQGKARILNTKKQHEVPKKESLHRRPRGKKRTNILHRVQSRNTTDVNNFIYELLGNLAALSNNQRHSKSKHFKVPGVKIKRQGRARNNNKTNNSQKIRKLSFAPSESPSRLSNYSVMSETMDSATSKASSVYNYNDSRAIDSDSQEPVDSKKGIKELMRRKSLVELINNYIKTGIKEDMKKEKRYIKKALSFGVNAGYLRPLDNSGHLLEVSSKLPGIMFNGIRDNVDERKRRKNMRRGIVSFDDYNVKSAKKRATTKKEIEKRHKETNTNISKKRERSISNINQSTSKIANKRNDKNIPPKKKTKIARQSRPAIRSSKRMRRRRSQTPWRKSNLFEKDDDSPHDNGENDKEKEHDNKNDNESNNSTTDAMENRKSATTIFRKDDSKNYHQNNSAHGSNDNFSAEIQPSIESTQEGDKQ